MAVGADRERGKPLPIEFDTCLCKVKTQVLSKKYI